MSRHKKRKKRNYQNNKTIKKTVTIKKENPLVKEINCIKNKISEENENINELNNQKLNITESIVDVILLNSDIKKLLNTYYEIDKEINERIKKQDNRKKDLSMKEKKLSSVNNFKEETITIEESQFKKIGEVPYKVGLYNRECKNPVAICKVKNVFLSYKDIRYVKHCLKHNNRPCKHLVWLKNDESIY